MSTARELMAAAVDPAVYEGKVKLPAEFDDIRLLQGSGNDSYISNLLNETRKWCPVIPQYRDIKEKVGGAIFGFYINHWVDGQNEIDRKLLDVFEEYEKNNKEAEALLKRICELEAKLNGSEEGAK